MLTDLIGRGIDYYYKTACGPQAPPDETVTYVKKPDYSLNTYVYAGATAVDRKDAPETVLAMFYGGAWHHGNHWQLAVIARDLARKGITVYLPEYRVASRHQASVADACQDVEQFYQWLNDRHPEAKNIFWRQ